MMLRHVYSLLTERKQQRRKSFALLLDPDNVTEDACRRTVQTAAEQGVDLFLVGGSLILEDQMEMVLRTVHNHSDIPAVLFPGSNLHVSPSADALLLLSLISGRNPEYLIGQHVVAAPMLRRSGLEIIPTGYMLVHCGNQTTVSYISHTTPIPYDKPAIAVATAMAGEMLGHQLIYMDGGSGAQKPISPDMIRAVSRHTSLPLVIGGGIRSGEQALAAWEAGADLVVIGNAAEKDHTVVPQVCQALRQLNSRIATV